MCLWLCTASVHNTTQNSSDNLPSYIQTTTIAQMLSIAGEGANNNNNINHNTQFLKCHMSNKWNCRHWPITERYGSTLKCFLKRCVFSWRLNASSPTESNLDVSSGGRLFQMVAEEWLKARRPELWQRQKINNSMPTCQKTNDKPLRLASERLSWLRASASFSTSVMLTRHRRPTTSLRISSMTYSRSLQANTQPGLVDINHSYLNRRFKSNVF